MDEKSVAIHEAAHFYFGWKVGHDVQTLTIIPSEDGALGTSLKRPGADVELDDGTNYSRARNENLIIESLVGPAAEYRYLGRVVWEVLPSELHNAVQYACRRHFDGSTEDVVAYVEYLWVVSKSFVAEPLNWLCITSLADALLKTKTLNASQAIPVLEDAKRLYMGQHSRRRQPVCEVMDKQDYDPLIGQILRDLGAQPT